MQFFVVRDKSRRVWRQGVFYASASPTQGFLLWGTDKTVFKEFRLPHNFTPTCITRDREYLYLFIKQVCFYKLKSLELNSWLATYSTACVNITVALVTYGSLGGHDLIYWHNSHCFASLETVLPSTSAFSFVLEQILKKLHFTINLKFDVQLGAKSVFIRPKFLFLLNY